jgi:hypothetical protein
LHSRPRPYRRSAFPHQTIARRRCRTVAGDEIPIVETPDFGFHDLDDRTRTRDAGLRGRALRISAIDDNGHAVLA